MILTREGSDNSDVRIMARGNFSLGPGGLIGLLVALTVVTLGLAGVLAWQGYWPVLLIAMIQITLVVWVLIRAWERAWISEIIVVRPEWIDVTQQRHKRRRHSRLEAAWAVVEQECSEVAWYGPRIFLRSRGTRVELGRFLTVDEKNQLADCVRRAIAKHSALKGAINV